MTSSTTSSIRASGLLKAVGARAPNRNTTATAFRIGRKNPLMVVGAAVVIVWVLLSVFASVLAPADPFAQNVSDRLQPPSAQYPFGTDELGRDLFTRTLYGGRVTIPAGILVILFGSLLGVAVGAIAGFVGGAWDELLMRLTELFMAFPTIILAMAVAAALGPDIRNAIIALVVVWWPSYARLVRSLVLRVKRQEFVEAAQAVGATPMYILWRSVLPNCIAPALVLVTLDIGSAILTFAGLSFLGLGPEPRTPEWGRMISVGIDYFDQWWTWLFPGAAIALLVIAFNFIGDGLRDLFDPRLR